MNAARRALVVLALSPMLVGLQSCRRAVPQLRGTYKINTFEFVNLNPPANTGAPAPNIWIDTNTKLNASDATVTSSLPCSVMIDYTDNTATFTAAMFTAVKITYNDNTVDPSTAAIQLPLRIVAREYESVNSVAGGRVVRTKSWIISGKIPKVVTRAEPFRLQLEGYFLKDDGSRIAFAVDRQFVTRTEDSIKSGVDLLQDK